MKMIANKFSTSKSINEHDQQTDPNCALSTTCLIQEIPHIPLDEQAVKVPMILAEPTFQICLESHIKLEQPAIEIKRTNHHICLKECVALKSCQPKKFKLFANGYLREEVEYASASNHTENAICGNINSAIFKIPFQVSTTLIFPDDQIGILFLKTTEEEASFKCLEGIAPSDLSFFQTAVNYNRCHFRMISSKIRSYDIGEPCNKDGYFEILNKFLVINLKIELIQSYTKPLIDLYFN